jgi:hypothetical protein
MEQGETVNCEKCSVRLEGYERFCWGCGVPLGTVRRISRFSLLGVLERIYPGGTSWTAALLQFCGLLFLGILFVVVVF